MSLFDISGKPRNIRNSKIVSMESSRKTKRKGHRSKKKEVYVQERNARILALLKVKLKEYCRNRCL